jgi:hypothetical protein
MAVFKYVDARLPNRLRSVKKENIFKDKFSHLKVDNDHPLWHKLREKNKPFFIFVLTLLRLTSHERF